MQPMDEAETFILAHSWEVHSPMSGRPIDFDTTFAKEVLRWHKASRDQKEGNCCLHRCAVCIIKQFRFESWSSTNVLFHSPSKGDTNTNYDCMKFPPW